MKLFGIAMAMSCLHQIEDSSERWLLYETSLKEKILIIKKK